MDSWLDGFALNEFVGHIGAGLHQDIGTMNFAIVILYALVRLQVLFACQGLFLLEARAYSPRVHLAPS